MDLTTKKNWKMVRLEEIAYVNMGQSPTSDTYNQNGDGLPFYQGVTEFGDKYLYIKSYTTNPIKVAEVGDVIFSVRAPVGRVNITKNKCCIGRGNASLRVKSGDQDFLYFLLKSLEKMVLSQSSGTVFDSINKDQLNNLEISVPESVDEQREIAAVLGCLDDKIELLRKENKTLEEIAQTLFKEWFVNFNFPGATGKMIDSELGEIPDGWRVGKLGEMAEITSGKRPSEISEKQNSDFKYPLLGASSIMGYVNDYLFNKEVFVIGRVGTHGLIQRFSEKIWPSDNTLVLSAKYPEFLHQILKTINFELLNKGAVQPLITQSDMKVYEVLIPNEEVLLSFESVIGALSSKIKNNNLEIKTLSKLRDELLNKIFG